VRRADSNEAVPVPQNARAAPKDVAKGSDVESIRSRAIRGELPSLSHLLELAHAVGSQAERTAAESERNRKTDEAAVRTLIESGLGAAARTLWRIRVGLSRVRPNLPDAGAL
jgi:hypothetical protein